MSNDRPIGDKKPKGLRRIREPGKGPTRPPERSGRTLYRDAPTHGGWIIPRED